MLTTKQENFAKAIVEGMNQADAYRSAYSCKNMSDNSIYVNASKLVNDTKVALRIKELREQLVKPTIMTAQQRLEWLTRLINSDKETTGDKLKAADIMNKMQGEYVQKVQANVSYEDNLRELIGEDEY